MEPLEATRAVWKPLEQLGTVRFGVDNPETADLIERHSWPRTYVVGRSCVLTEEPLVAYAALGFVPCPMVEGAYERVAQLQSLPDFRIDYMSACHAIGQRVFGSLPAADELADRLENVTTRLVLAGVPLAAGWAGTPRPQGAGARIERAATILREYRGALHNTVLLTHGLLGAEALIVHGLWRDTDPAGLLRFYGWREQDAIDQAWERLRVDGRLDGQRLTADAIAERQAIEERTDQLAAQPWMVMDEADRKRLVQLVQQATSDA